MHGLQHMEGVGGGVGGVGGWINEKKRESPDFRPPEVSISAYQ